MFRFATPLALISALLACNTAEAGTPSAELLASFPQDPTQLLWNIRPKVGQTSDASANVVPALYFNVPIGQPPTYELWVSDGTPQGTHRAAANQLELASRQLASPEVGIFFTAYDANAQLQIFHTTGVESSARALTLEPIFANAALKSVFGNSALFSRPGESGQASIWRVGGDSGVATLLGQLPGTNEEIATASGNVIAPSRSMVFGDHIASFPEAGKSMIDLPAPIPSTQWDYPHRIASGPRIACLKSFTHYPSGDVIQELSCSDGTPGGTHRPALGVAGAGVRLTDGVVFHPLGDKFLMDGVFESPYHHPWVTDGTDEGTFPVINTSMIDWWPCSSDRAGSIYFVSTHGNGATTLWVTDGSQEGTHAVIDLPAFSSSCGFRGLSQSTSNLAYLQIGTVLIQTNGTAAGTIPVAGAPALAQGWAGQESPVGVVAMGRWLVFFAPVSANEGGLWRLDLDPIYANGMDE